LKRYILMIIVLILAVGLLAACGSDNKSSQPDNTTGGGTTQPAGVDPEKIYAANCASCHGGNLSGGVGPGLTDVGSRLSQDEILAVIQNGKGIMQGNIIKGEDADAVAAWLADKK